jgi:hypothetical protein
MRRDPNRSDFLPMLANGAGDKKEGSAQNDPAEVRFEAGELGRGRHSMMTCSR